MRRESERKREQMFLIKHFSMLTALTISPNNTKTHLGSNLVRSFPSQHVYVGPIWVTNGLQGYRVDMGSKWASYLGPTWVN